MYEPEKGYLVDVETGEKLVFQFNPEALDDTKETDYATIDVPGMSHPKVQFTSGGARSVAFTLRLYKTDQSEQVEGQIRWLQSLQYPEYDEDGYLVAGPHRVLFVFGTMFTGNSKFVVKNVKPHYTNMFTPELAVRYAEVSVELLECIEESVDYRDVRG